MLRKANTICVFTDHSTIGFRSVMKGIAFAARERDWTVRAIDLSQSSVGISELLEEWRPTGSLSYYMRPDRFPWRCACVHINPRGSANGAWTVRHDSRETGGLAAHELLKLAGRTYAYIGDLTNAPWSRIRGEHFAQTLARFGFGCASCNIPRAPMNPIVEQRTLLRWIKGLNLPCAIFAANDRTAESVLAAALSAGLSVPEDLAILGVDDDANLCENAPVTLSSIVPDFFRGGVLGCALLDRRISDPKSAPHTETCYGDLGVTIRSSTRPQLKPSVLITHMREFIRLHAATGISAVDVIRETRRQRRGIELAFKSATGKTIGEELQDVRIALAQRALADESIPIGEIPGLVGYVSQNQLERLFKRTCGMTMRTYRHLSVAKRYRPNSGTSETPFFVTTFAARTGTDGS